MSQAWKQAAWIVGLVSLLIGLVIAPGGCCWLALFASSDARQLTYNNMFPIVTWSILLALFAGGGGLLLYHASRSQRGEPSRPLRLPQPWLLGWGFVLLLILGEAMRRSIMGTIFFMPIFTIAAMLPTLSVMAWIVRQSERIGWLRSQSLTWRQFSIAALLGGTLSAALAVLLEVLAPTALFFLIEGLYEMGRDTLQAFLNGLLGQTAAGALGSRGFWLLMAEIAVIAPLVEEFVKPLGILPLLRVCGHRGRAFLLGVAAGGGFAIVEDWLYTAFGVNLWGGILLLRAIGIGIHMLGTGWVALGWYEAMSNSKGGWLRRYGFAVGLHALWNGGTAVMVALTRVEVLGARPAEVTAFGATTAGVLLAMMGALGAAALILLGRMLYSLEGESTPGNAIPWPVGGMLSGRAIALWALICLLAALPLGMGILNVLGIVK